MVVQTFLRLHMHRTFTSRALALISLLFALPSLIGAAWLEDVTPMLRGASFITGALLLAAAWQLFNLKRTALSLLWLSLAIYVGTIFVPSLLRHGNEVFGSLIPAFYWSVSMRLSLALASHWALRSVASPASGH